MKARHGEPGNGDFPVGRRRGVGQDLLPLGDGLPVEGLGPRLPFLVLDLGLLELAVGLRAFLVQQPEGLLLVLWDFSSRRLASVSRAPSRVLRVSSSICGSLPS